MGDSNAGNERNEFKHQAEDDMCELIVASLQAINKGFHRRIRKLKSQMEGVCIVIQKSAQMEREKESDETSHLLWVPKNTKENSQIIAKLLSPWVFALRPSMKTDHQKLLFSSDTATEIREFFNKDLLQFIQRPQENMWGADISAVVGWMTPETKEALIAWNEEYMDKLGIVIHSWWGSWRKLYGMQGKKQLAEFQLDATEMLAKMCETLKRFFRLHRQFYFELCKLRETSDEIVGKFYAVGDQEELKQHSGKESIESRKNYTIFPESKDVFDRGEELKRRDKLNSKNEGGDHFFHMPTKGVAKNNSNENKSALGEKKFIRAKFNDSFKELFDWYMALNERKNISERENALKYELFSLANFEPTNVEEEVELFNRYTRLYNRIFSTDPVDHKFDDLSPKIISQTDAKRDELRPKKESNVQNNIPEDEKSNVDSNTSNVDLQNTEKSFLDSKSRLKGVAVEKTKMEGWVRNKMKQLPQSSSDDVKEFCKKMWISGRSGGLKASGHGQLQEMNELLKRIHKLKTKDITSEKEGEILKILESIFKGSSKDLRLVLLQTHYDKLKKQEQALLNQKTLKPKRDQKGSKAESKSAVEDLGPAQLEGRNKTEDFQDVQEKGEGKKTNVNSEQEGTQAGNGNPSLVPAEISSSNADLSEKNNQEIKNEMKKLPRNTSQEIQSNVERLLNIHMNQNGVLEDFQDDLKAIFDAVKRYEELKHADKNDELKNDELRRLDLLFSGEWSNLVHNLNHITEARNLLRDGLRKEQIAKSNESNDRMRYDADLERKLEERNAKRRSLKERGDDNTVREPLQSHESTSSQEDNQTPGSITSTVLNSQSNAKNTPQGIPEEDDAGRGRNDTAKSGLIAKNDLESMKKLTFINTPSSDSLNDDVDDKFKASMWEMYEKCSFDDEKQSLFGVTMIMDEADLEVIKNNDLKKKMASIMQSLNNKKKVNSDGMIIFNTTQTQYAFFTLLSTIYHLLGSVYSAKLWQTLQGIFISKRTTQKSNSLIKTRLIDCVENTDWSVVPSDYQTMIHENIAVLLAKTITLSAQTKSFLSGLVEILAIMGILKEFSSKRDLLPIEQDELIDCMHRKMKYFLVDFSNGISRAGTPRNTPRTQNIQENNERAKNYFRNSGSITKVENEGPKQSIASLDSMQQGNVRNYQMQSKGGQRRSGVPQKTITDIMRDINTPSDEARKMGERRQVLEEERQRSSLQAMNDTAAKRESAAIFSNQPSTLQGTYSMPYSLKSPPVYRNARKRRTKRCQKTYSNCGSYYNINQDYNSFGSTYMTPLQYQYYYPYRPIYSYIYHSVPAMYHHYSDPMLYGYVYPTS